MLWCRYTSGGALREAGFGTSTVRMHGDWKGASVGHDAGVELAAPELGKPQLRHRRLYFPQCDPRDRSPFNAGKIGAGRTKAQEILHARHDFPHYCCNIQLLMANPSTCAGLRRNLAENPAPYRTIPHGWAFRPRWWKTMEP
jgi:hypothetical protein